VLCLVLAAAACGRDVPTFPKAPVVLISIDTMRADRLPAYGYAKVRTPYLDRFQHEAWFFENPYSPCPMTLPAHTSMLTGQLPFEHGVRNNVGFVFDGGSHPSLPALLKAKGYATGAAVSSYVLRYETGLGRIFDFYEDSTGPTPGVESIHYRRSGDKTAAFARDWIAKHVSEPLFFFFHIYEPHRPYEPPEPFKTEYGVGYDAEVATADAIVGAFLGDLKRLGVYDRAIVIITGDHGEGLGDHGEEQHSILLYREAIRVPLMVRLPGAFGAGRRIAAPVQHSDILPTVTSALGVETPKEVSGSSLLTLDGKRKPDRVIYGETLFPRLQLGWADLTSVLDARYHYIHGPRPELYDMTADPGELHDLIRTEATVAARLSKELQRFPQGNQKPAAADQETLKRLAALGYIGGLRDTSGATNLPNPIDNLQYLRRMQDAWRLADDGKYLPAIEILRSILQENPAMIDVWIKLGEVLSEVGLDGEAAAAYRQALDRSPVFLPDITASLGYAELRLSHLTEAEALARRALDKVPTKAQELLARVFLAKGDLKAAAEHARAAVGERNPQPSAVLLMAEVDLRAGEAQEALGVVEKAEAYAKELRLQTVYNLEFLRGDALARLNRVDDAEAAFRREIAAFPMHSQSYANLAVIRFLRGDRAEVDQLMDAMVRANPSPRACLLAASTLDSLGDKARAESWRRRAETLNKG
jgi:arylsulfatase A-like enzyme/Flp pilus assembly protein TadD